MNIGPRFAGARPLVAATLIALVLATLTAGGGGAAGAAADPGKCAEPSGVVKVGISYFGGVENNLGEIGAEETADITPATRAILDGYKAGTQALNDQGGLAGCEVEPVIFNFSAASSDFNQTSQQECAAFTQDDRVLAVFATAYETRVAVDCFAKAKTPFFTAGANYPPTCADYKEHAGYVYSVASVATCRFDSFIGMWNTAGLFPKDAKVGILAMDDGSGQGKQLAEKVWTPALKHLKMPVETFTYTGAINSATFADVNAALANAVLKFKADGVNVVLFTPAGAQGVAAFMPQAETQGYFPNYGLTSADGLQIASTLGGTAIKKAIAISWTIADLPLAAQQALPANPTIEACASWSTPSTTALTGSTPYCDFLGILGAGLRGATKADAKALQKGIEGLGTTFVSSMTYEGATKLARHRSDGATRAMMLEFDPATKSFVPMSDEGSIITVP
jgi:ABC-type branched-subunit amino acid transport system substrate-binding protein